MSPTSKLGNRQGEKKMCLQLLNPVLFFGRCWQPNRIIFAYGTPRETLWVSQCQQQAGEQTVPLHKVPPRWSLLLAGVGVWTQPHVLGPTLYPEPLRPMCRMTGRAGTARAGWGQEVQSSGVVLEASAGGCSSSVL